MNHWDTLKKICIESGLKYGDTITHPRRCKFGQFIVKSDSLPTRLILEEWLRSVLPVQLRQHVTRSANVKCKESFSEQPQNKNHLNHLRQQKRIVRTQQRRNEK